MTYPIMAKFGRVLLSSAISVALLTATASADDIRFWTTEEQPDRMAKQQEMAKQFEKANEYLNFHINAKDSMINEQSSKAIASR